MTVTVRHAPLSDEAGTLKAAMRRLAGGVSVVTAGTGEEKTGLTVTSVASLSMDPPTMIICVNRDASAWPVIRRERHYAVNILGARHQHIFKRCDNPRRLVTRHPRQVLGLAAKQCQCALETIRPGGLSASLEGRQELQLAKQICRSVIAVAAQPFLDQHARRTDRRRHSAGRLVRRSILVSGSGGGFGASGTVHKAHAHRGP